MKHAYLLPRYYQARDAMSVVLLHHLITLDMDFALERVGYIPRRTKQVEPLCTSQVSVDR